VDRLLDVDTAESIATLRAVEDAARLSHARGRRLSGYSLDPQIIAALGERGFTITPACFYVLLARETKLEDQKWWFANGDRM
jgi:hypothetical protein